jgi:hypothetical protein
MANIEQVALPEKGKALYMQCQPISAIQDERLQECYISHGIETSASRYQLATHGLRGIGNRIQMLSAIQRPFK